MKTINDYKKEATLNKKMRFDEGIMTRLEWLRLKVAQGCRVEETTKNRIDFSRTKFNRCSSWEEQKEYERKCNERVPSYRLYEAGKTSFWEITKTEFEKFNDLLLSFDLQTEKHELQNKVDAGIATDKEIAEDAQSDIDFINKYYN